MLKIKIKNTTEEYIKNCFYYTKISYIIQLTALKNYKMNFTIM